MKRFLTEVAIFVLLLISGAYMIDAFVTANLKKYPKGELGIWNQIFAGKINSEIVIYGASRALVHFDARIMQDSLRMTVYNLGMNGHNFWLQYLRHAMLLKFNTKPKVIVLELSQYTLSKRSDLHDPDQFLPYMLNNPQVEASTSSYEGYKYLDYHIYLFRYYGKSEALLRSLVLFLRPSSFTPDRVQGYEAMNLAWNGDWERARRTLQPSKTFNDPETKRLFESFLEESRNLEIKVIFVSTPEFVEGQQYWANRDETIAYFREMSNKHGVPYLDYSKDPISYQTEYFYDHTHMNRLGAELFTSKLMMDIRTLVTRYYSLEQ
jgi:hypothetical protein